MGEILDNYSTALSLIFFFEAASQSLLYPLGPFLVASNHYFRCLNFTNWNQRLDPSHQDTGLNSLKGDLAFSFALYLLVFYLFQGIGMFYWYELAFNSLQSNMKRCLAVMVLAQALSVVVISMRISPLLVISMRAAVRVCIMKLTLDNRIHLEQDILKLVNMTALWFLGSVIGVTAGGILSSPQNKFYQGFSSFSLVDSYPFLLPSVLNLVLAILLMVVLLAIFPHLQKKKKQYKKMQSTMFQQSIFFLSQNEFTSEITRHQRTRSTFDRMLLKRIIWQDRNLLFALLYQGLGYSVFFGLLEVRLLSADSLQQIFPLYCLTVLDIKNEIFISIVYTMAMLAVFVFQLCGSDVNFLDKENRQSKTNKDLALSWTWALVAIAGFYLLRLFSTLNSYILLGMAIAAFTLFCISFYRIISLNNYLIEQTALNCCEDADHARNIAQINASAAKVLGTFVFCIFATFNFWHLHNLYYDFIYVFGLSMATVALSYLVLACLDRDWKEPESDSFPKAHLLQSEMEAAREEVFA